MTQTKRPSNEGAYLDYVSGRYDLNSILDCVRQNGAVLLRGEALCEEDFKALSDRLIVPVVHHSTGAMERDSVGADATTSTVNKGMDAIPLHREGSYAPGCPDLLMLYCVKPAEAEGETTLCDGVALFESLPAGIRAFVADAPLIWNWTVPRPRWQATLAVNTREEAAARLNRMMAAFASWERLQFQFSGDDLEGVYRTLCAIPTKFGSQKSFCNSLLIYYYRGQGEFFPRNLLRPTLEDGTEFPQDILDTIAQQAELATFAVQWNPGDILVVDNSRFMHGRRGFADTTRRILIRMGRLREGIL